MASDRPEQLPVSSRIMPGGPAAGRELRLAPPPRRSMLARVLVVLVLGVGLGTGSWWLWETHGRAWWTSRGTQAAHRATYVVKRGDLPITVTESGSLRAVNSEVISSQVEGKATILELVPEGTIITPEDVQKGKILAKLDSADLSERLTQQEITFVAAEATYTQAREAYEIQKSQGESDINKGKLDVKFGRMDLERSVGESLASVALASKVDLLQLARRHHEATTKERERIESDVGAALQQVERASREAAATRKKTPVPPVPAREGGPSPEPSKTPPADRPESRPPQPIVPLAEERMRLGADAKDAAPLPELKSPFRTVPAAAGDLPELGGAALQNKRKLESEIDLAVEEFKRAADTLNWTVRLESKGFVSHNELEADQLALKRKLVALEQALTARDLFLRYEFPKEAEKLLSVYAEAQRELGRVEAKARSTLAQKEADRSSSKSTYDRQKGKLDKLKEQVGFCIIRAPQPGIVVYASSGDDHRNRSMQGPIEVGSAVHEQQEIIRLPDITSLAVGVGIHESLIDKISVNQEANIRIDAVPNTTFHGKVRKIGILPQSQRWWNPDLKVYDTEITIEGNRTDLKPGMSAEVEIKVKTLRDVLLVPVQTVIPQDGKNIVYALRGDREEPREVTVGEANEYYVEILTGLSEGEVILKEAPRTIPVERRSKEKPEDQEPAKDAKGSAAAKGSENASEKTPAAGRPAGGERPAGERGSRPRSRPK
jgi:RND family efflux transporter MFP subunit